MSYLISRSEAVKVAKGFTFTDETQKRQYMDFLHYCLDNTPIAYDLSKVVSELEDMKFVRVEQCHEDYEIEVMTESNFDDAIEIVKRGVSNEID